MSSLAFLKLSLSGGQLSLKSIDLKGILANQASLSFVGFFKLYNLFGLHITFLFGFLDFSDLHMLELY